MFTWEAVTSVVPTRSQVREGNYRQELHMTGSVKAYSAPRLESLSLRATRDIDINIGAGVEIHLGLPLGS